MRTTEIGITAVSKRIYVVCYYRKSSAAYDAQAASIDDQRKACRKYCADRGWIIVAEYVDESSGSKDQERRVDFNRMIADSAARKWTAVVVWDSSRFSRMDTLDGAESKKTLRTNGVHLESTKEGEIDWATDIGRMKDFMQSEGNSKFSRDLSTNSLRGRKSTMEAGFIPHGKTPWGYDRQYWCEGQLKMTVPFGEKFIKPKNWKKKLVVNPHAEFILWMFEMYGLHDWSMRRLAKELGTKGILTPSGNPHWSIRSVVEVLSNPAYVGEVCIGVRPSSPKKKGAFGQAEPARQLSCPVVVPRDLFDRVQKRLKERENVKQKVYSSVRVKSGALSGFLICGNCGHALSKKVGPNGHTIYVCQSKSVRPSHGCATWRVHESIIMPHVIKALVDAIDFEMVKATAAQPPVKNESDLKRLSAQIIAAEKAVATGTANLLKSDPDVFPLLQTALKKSKADLERMRNTLQIATAEKPERDGLIVWYESIKSRLVYIPVPPKHRKAFMESFGLPSLMEPGMDKHVECFVDSDMDKLRSLLRQLNVNVTIWWRRNGRRNYTLERGLMRASFLPDQVTLPGLGVREYKYSHEIAEVI